MASRTRREFFSNMVDGLHGAALATLLGSELAQAATYDLQPRPPHFPAKAKSVIHLFMNGGPSQVDLFDPKPTLKRLAGTAPSRELSFAISNRSEEHTSELQSHLNLVCRLLLEKKNKD